MNRIFSAFRSQRDAAATRKAMRHLDNHLLRDIGLPEREETRNFFNL
ncbi:MAG: DUF1127 domain-containing protein [Pseudomonadota bacterium]